MPHSFEKAAPFNKKQKQKQSECAPFKRSIRSIATSQKKAREYNLGWVLFFFFLVGYQKGRQKFSGPVAPWWQPGKNKRRPWMKQKKCRACTLFSSPEWKARVRCFLHGRRGVTRAVTRSPSIYLRVLRGRHHHRRRRTPRGTRTLASSPSAFPSPASRRRKTPPCAPATQGQSGGESRQGGMVYDSVVVNFHQGVPQMERLRLPFTEVRRRASLHLGVTSVT